jgi:hypothetical protein
LKRAEFICSTLPHTPLFWCLLAIFSLAYFGLYLTLLWLTLSFRLPLLPPYVISLSPISSLQPWRWIQLTSLKRLLPTSLHGT